MIRFKRATPRWAPSEASKQWQDSTFAELAWDKSRGASRRWAIAGAIVGLLAGLVIFAPASWLARAVASATQERVILADARGSIWNGSAMLLLTGGPNSRDASALPGRFEWTMGLRGLGFELRAKHACCLNGEVALRLQPGWGRMTATLVPPASGWVGQWPSAWLGGLGTPWNTLQLNGSVRLTSSGLTIESVQGRWRVTGQAQLELRDLSSRLSTLQPLGSYQFLLKSDAGGTGASQLTLITQSGALQLSGEGTWSASGIRFRGEATATEANQTALQNLLNIIGRREGARSVISIG
jgi:general secretion pathway protein N